MEVIDDFFTDVNGKSKGQTALDELKPLVDGYVVADGLTGNIIEKGGEGIPINRDKDVYGELFTKVEKEDEIIYPNTIKKTEENLTLDKAYLEKTIKSLKIALKYSKGKVSINIQKQIKSLEIALKYA
jgi:hypothetical protein